MSLVAVTGATGALGGRVAHLLSAAGVEQRLVVRDATRAPDLGAPVAVASYKDADAAVQALHGVDTLFMVSGAEEPDRVGSHRTFIDAAVEAGVRTIVYTSFFGAGPNATFTLARDHWATEEHIKASGLAWTFLRDNLYLDVLPLFFSAEDHVMKGPAGDGRFAGVARDDVADCAVAVLRDPARFAGRTYNLTGPAAITAVGAAAIIESVTGRPARFVNETIEEAYASRAKYGAPQWQVDAWVSTYVAIAKGELDGVTDDVLELSGHEPMSLAELLSRPR